MRRAQTFATLVILAFLEVACIPTAPSPTATPFHFLTATPRSTATPTPSSTPTATLLIPSPTPTITPIITIPSSPLPQLSPAPTATIPGLGGASCPPLPEGFFRQVYQSDPGLPSALGCPIGPTEDTPPQSQTVDAIIQTFERGYMLWLSHHDWQASPLIYALLDDSTCTAHRDTYDPQRDPFRGVFIPPLGLYQPTGRLGKVWREVPGLREQLGFATALEQSFGTTMQPFRYGQMISIWPLQAVFAIRPGQPGSWSHYAVQP